MSAEASTLLKEVFAKFADPTGGISDLNVFAQEIVVPLLGLGEYMARKKLSNYSDSPTGKASSSSSSFVVPISSIKDSRDLFHLFSSDRFCPVVFLSSRKKCLLYVFPPA